MNRRMKLSVGVMVILLLVLMGCSAGDSPTTPIHAIVVPDESGNAMVTTEEEPLILEVVLYPANGSISLKWDRTKDVGFGIGSSSYEGSKVDLPEGYKLQRRISFNGTYGEANGQHFELLIGLGELPVYPVKIVYLPLTEEIRVPITREGLTQVLFTEEPPPCVESSR